MNSLISSFKWFNLRRLPIRLALATAVAVIVPISLLFVAANNRATELDELVATGYVERMALERKEHIEEHITSARSSIRNLVSKQYYFTEFVEALDNPTAESISDVTKLMQLKLVDSTAFTKGILFNPAGELVASTSPEDFTVDTHGETSLAYTAALDALLIGERQVFVAGTLLDGEQTVEIGQIITRDNGTAAGYLIGKLNVDEVLLHNMPPLTDFIPLISFLVQDGGLIFAQDGVHELINHETITQFMDQGRQGLTEITNLFYEDRQVIVHYTPVRNSSFVLFTETIQEIQLSPTIGLFSANSTLVAVSILAFVIVMAWVFYVLVAQPLQRLRGAISAMSSGNFNVHVPFASVDDPLGLLAREFSNLRQQVRDQIDDLETRIAARVHDIQATQDISRSVATQRDLQKLMDDVVYLIIKTFPNIYHAQIFLINDELTYAVLRASTNEPGEKLLARGHRLGVGSISVIGQVTQEGRTVVAVDTSTSDVHRRNEFLPDTRAELAIPLRIGERIIGALDVQSKQPNSFTPDQVTVLQIMADQVAISIDNARLYQSYQRQLEELALSKKQSTHGAWLEHLFDERKPLLEREIGTRTLTDFDALREQAVITAKAVVGEMTDHNTIPVVLPVELRGQVLGTVEWELPAGDFSNDKVQLAEELVSRLAVSLDNARLFQQSQRTAERERVVNTIAASLTGQTDIDEILQTTVREVGKALRVPEVKIRLQVGQNGHHADDSEEKQR